MTVCVNERLKECKRLNCFWVLIGKGELINFLLP